MVWKVMNINVEIDGQNQKAEYYLQASVLKSEVCDCGMASICSYKEMEI